MKRLYDRECTGQRHRGGATRRRPTRRCRRSRGRSTRTSPSIGGGFTGLWTALEVLRRRPSANVVVLEAGRCGDGASGRNGGFLHGLWAALPRLVEALGADDAVAVAREATGVYDAIRALGEDVWLNESGMLTVATGRAHDALLEHADAAVAAEVGAPDGGRRGLAGRADRPVAGRFWAPSVYRDGATVQPARLVRALRKRRACRRRDRARADAGARASTAAGVSCARGVVRAEEIVLATNAAAARWPATRTVAVFRSAIVLTEPVADLHDRIGWENGEAISDARTYLNYFRPTNDGRVLMGSASGEYPHAEAALRTLFPQLADVPIAASWEGAIDVSSDRLPVVATVAGHPRALRPRLHGERRRAELARRPYARTLWRSARTLRRRSSPGGCLRCRPSRCARSAPASCAARCSPSTTPSPRGGAHRRASRPVSHGCRSCSGCA